MIFEETFDSTNLSLRYIERTAPGQEYASMRMSDGFIEIETYEMENAEENDGPTIASLVYSSAVGRVTAEARLSELLVEDAGNQSGLCISNANHNTMYYVLGSVEPDPNDSGISFGYVQKDEAGEWYDGNVVFKQIDDPVGTMLHIERDGPHVKCGYIDSDGEFESLFASHDFPTGPAVVHLLAASSSTDSITARFDTFRLDYESPFTSYLWYLLPDWLKYYPFMADATGDLMLTQDGVRCLMQDIADLIDTSPGDLFGHPSVGAGVVRFLGRPDTCSERARLTGQIEAALRSKGIAPRIDPGGSKVKVTSKSESQIEVLIEVVAKDGTKRLPLNLVYQYGIDNISRVLLDQENPGFDAGAGDLSEYSYPAFGRDVLLDRSVEEPMNDPSLRSQLPQWHWIESVGSELDKVGVQFRLIRDEMFFDSAREGLLGVLAWGMGVDRLYEENDGELRGRLYNQWADKTSDGTLSGLLNRFNLYGLEGELLEGFDACLYTLTEELPDEWTWLPVPSGIEPGSEPWYQIWVILRQGQTDDEPPTSIPINITEEYFYQQVRRHRRAGRQIVYKQIEGGHRIWTKNQSWSEGHWNDHKIFVHDHEYDYTTDEQQGA